VDVKQIYEISNTHLSSEFNSNNITDSAIYESFIPIDSLPENNSFSNVFQRGYEFIEKMIFTLGFS
jgi:hypothetical protein